MILLDTCALLALAASPLPFSAEARNLLEQAAVDVAVSAITAFEIGQKYASGKLELSHPPARWYASLLDHYQLREIDVSANIAFLATALPPIHRDPFDRILIATALVHKLTVITCDRMISTYPGIQTLW